MKKIIDTFAGLRPCDGEWGVEIEVEGDNLPVQLRDWRVERDGSLKAAEAYEYVMPKPLDKKGVLKALKGLQDTYDAMGSKPSESVRAGVHVHMNVQKWTTKQMFAFSTCYFILEPLLTRWCGPNRQGNLFCLSSEEAEYQLFAIQEAVEKKNWRPLRTDHLRYASLNFQSLFKYGSLEFRSMRSTPDLDLIYKWVEILEQLRDNSLRYSDPHDVMMSFSGEGEESFLRRLLPSYWQELTYPGYEKAIRRACRRVQMLAYTIDWEKIGQPVNNPFVAQEAFA